MRCLTSTFYGLSQRQKRPATASFWLCLHRIYDDGLLSVRDQTDMDDIIYPNEMSQLTLHYPNKTALCPRLFHSHEPSAAIVCRRQLLPGQLLSLLLFVLVEYFWFCLGGRRL